VWVSPVPRGLMQDLAAVIPAAPVALVGGATAEQVARQRGVTLMSGDNLHLRLDYSGQFGSDYRGNGGSLKVSYFF
jgi:hypothetical protein